jgi:hypothetical protein
MLEHAFRPAGAKSHHVVHTNEGLLMRGVLAVIAVCTEAHLSIGALFILIVKSVFALVRR